MITKESDQLKLQDEFMYAYKFILKTTSLIYLVILLCTCSDNPTSSIYPPDNSDKVTIKQGVWGNVWFWEGDFEPGGPPSGKITPVIRIIFIYEATHYSMVEPNSGVFYTKINTKLITTIISNNNGYFQIPLPSGKYSFFVKENGMYYANGTDNEGHILSAVVVENEVTKQQINIDYKATF